MTPYAVELPATMPTSRVPLFATAVSVTAGEVVQPDHVEPLPENIIALPEMTPVPLTYPGVLPPCKLPAVALLGSEMGS